MKCAPVLIPTLCRYEHFKRCVESLKVNSYAPYTNVFIGVDYPSSAKHVDGWKKIINYLETSDFSMFASVTIIKHDYNLGPSANSKYLRERIFALGYDRWIYMEDDIYCAPNFLEYINKCLEYYEKDIDVVGVTGFSYPIIWKVSEGATCFKQQFNASMWGSGFWKSKMQIIDNFLRNRGVRKSIYKLLDNKRYLEMIDTAKIEYAREVFSLIDFYSINWARVPSDIGIRMYLAIENKFFISPVISKTRNYGFDGSGVNCQNLKYKCEEKLCSPIDNNPSFNLIEDSLNDYHENRDRMNRFEMKTRKEMRRTNILFRAANCIGVGFARFCMTCCIPYDLAKAIISKYLTSR